MQDKRLTVATTGWISVAFLQGDDADKVLGIIYRDGETAAMAQLHSLDHGDETTDAALTHGYVYDRIPAGSTDRTVEDADSPYALTYSARYRYVSLLRRYRREPESELDSTPRTRLTEQARPRHDMADIWHVSADRATSNTMHTVSLR